MTWNINQSGVAGPKFLKSLEETFDSNINSMGMEEEKEVLTGIKHAALAQVKLFAQGTHPHAVSVYTNGHGGKHQVGDVLNVYGAADLRVVDLGVLDAG